MGYTQLIDAHWRASVRRAKADGANEKQLRCLQSLARFEFGARSGLRLREDCLWDTKVDRDGDVVLTFINPTGFFAAVVGANAPGGHRVRVAIDHEAVITISDIDTGRVEVCNPYDAGPTEPLWTLSAQLLRPFTEPNIIVQALYGALAVYVKDVDCVFSPVLLGPVEAERLQITPLARVVHVTASDNGPISGFLRTRYSLCWFQRSYEDEITGQRIYTVAHLTRLQALQVHLAVAWRWVMGVLGGQVAPLGSMGASTNRPSGYFML